MNYFEYNLQKNVFDPHLSKTTSVLISHIVQQNAAHILLATRIYLNLTLFVRPIKKIIDIFWGVNPNTKWTDLLC
jgi:hypothetical protein